VNNQRNPEALAPPRTRLLVLERVEELQQLVM
jgi:hypothetical protein